MSDTFEDALPPTPTGDEVSCTCRSDFLTREILTVEPGCPVHPYDYDRAP